MKEKGEMKKSLLFLFLAMKMLAAVKVSASQVATPDQAIEWLQQNQVANSKAWQKLLYYNHSYFRIKEFQVDDPGFYLGLDRSKSDQENFVLEMNATVRSFYETLQNPEETSTICRFPARYVYLQNLLKKDQIFLPSKNCPRFEMFLQAIAGESVSIIFSSYYLNNPSSAYGHTFLRFNKPRNQRMGQSELLDYGLNFAANPTTNNAFLYSILGLAGGFKGTFTTQPYYFKVREYNNSESRDLWEYQLSLSSAEVDFLVRHLWEVGPSWIDYFYLSENCSYHVLSLIELARPSLDLLSKLKPNVIPTDTIQILSATPGLVTDIRYRPSIRKQFYSRAGALTEDQKKEVLRMFQAKSSQVSESYRSPDQQVQILDTLMDYIDFKEYYHVQIADSEVSRYKNKVLIARSQVPLVSKNLDIQTPWKEAPHLSHKTSRLGLGLRRSDDHQSLYDFSYRFALHDQLDPIQGYPDYAVIDFFSLRFNLNPKTGKSYTDEFTLIGLNSSAPIDLFSRTPSWRMQLGMLRLPNQNCWQCQAWGANGGIGATYLFGDDQNISATLSLLAAAYAWSENTMDVQSPYVLGIGPSVRLRYRIQDDLIAAAEHWTRWDSTGKFRDFNETSFQVQKSFDNSWGLRAKYVNYEFEQTFGMEWLWYH